MKENMIQGLDWYALSKLNIESIDLQQFNNIINGNTLKSDHLIKIPLSHRKRLLTLFQQSNQQMKKQIKLIDQHNINLVYRKKAIIQQQTQLQKQLQRSLAQITVRKQTVQDRKRNIKKIKQKIQSSKSKTKLTQKQIVSKQVYYCPFCTLNNFTTRSQFTAHVYTHQNNAQGLSNQNQLKQFILSLKDKQMQIMQMLLKQKKQVQRQQLERFYEKQMNKFMNIGNHQQYHIKQLQNAQLAGQSQYLFYKNHYQNQNARHLYRKEQSVALKFNKQQDQKYFNSPSIQQQYLNLKQFQRKNLNHQQYKYYNNMEINLKQKEEQKIPYFSQVAYNPLQSQDSIISKVNLQFKQQKNNFQYNDRHSIYKIDKNISNKSVYNQTIYSMKQQKNITNQVYIFNSGPIVDDKNIGDSDYQDYFEVIPPKKCEVGEQIITLKTSISKKNKNNQYYNKILAKQLTKNQINNSQSSIIDLSNSFSKRNQLQSSKEQINLSDLKLSKLNKAINNRKEIYRNNLQKNQQEDYRIQKNMKKKDTAKTILNKTKESSILDNEKKKIENQYILQQFSTKNIPKPLNFNNDFEMHLGSNIVQQKLKNNSSLKAINHNNNSNDILSQFLKHPSKNSMKPVFDLQQFMHQ